MSEGPSRFRHQSASQASVVTFLAYQSLSIAFYGLPALRDFSHSYIGYLTDPTIFSWSLVWWPYALRHGLNPFITSFAYAPSYNLTWTTSMPAASLLAYPVTWAFGPIVSQNVLCLVAPALAAWAAFVLCLYQTKSFWPSLVGGYIFGFSPYIGGQLLGHLPMVLVFPIPLAVYLMLRRLDDSISARRFVILQALLICLLALTWIEALATATLFTGMALLVGLLVPRNERRKQLWMTTLEIGCAYVVAALILSPWFYYTFASGVPSQPLNSPETYSVDLLGFFVPTVVSLIGRLPVFEAITARLAGGNVAETVAYIAPGILSVAALYAASNWHEASARILTYSLLLICLASLGPKLHIYGKPTITLPWVALIHVPAIDNALPCRFMNYAFLCLGLMASIYLTQVRSRLAAVLLGLLVVIPSLPNSGICH